jgi:branched-subunit amino acid aminotransferase/4-amino-4-deoxychorismate lyase
VIATMYCCGTLTERLPRPALPTWSLRIDGRLYTPPVVCGLLNGTLRQALLLQGKLAERTIRIDELAEIDEIYLINSVRGWRLAVIDEKSIAARSPAGSPESWL